MKRWTLFFLVFTAFTQGCGYKEKEQKLAQREAQIASTEQKLMEWQQQLTLLEKELLEKKKKQQQDSTVTTDSIQAQAITGKWVVKMRCTETSCSGSAIGDSKTETWEISYQNNALVVNAFTGSELSRIYNGSFSQMRLEASNGQPGSESVMRVRLELKDKKLEGTREVDRTDCKIRYSLTAERQK
ncbi:hypothetical protein DYBT9623_05400 [Dyadobacter sp. CECT 9623]|uniref:Lipocalin-like domain-containing protein n=1 Tax=Dyadobacter linearis TaxID=2823330 RepID=A0ABM8UZ93_9BACT|nr:hypothetical protein [Dyadobacter sp. CECT 9623]CAG5074712.1 hypothetical protein DYBT9623_05400 [Dyadobacter sp. CECT 9623]